MLKMKPHIDRERVLKMEARRRALATCTQRIPALLHEQEAVSEPIREGDRIVLHIVREAQAKPAVPA